MDLRALDNAARTVITLILKEIAWIIVEVTLPNSLILWYLFLIINREISNLKLMPFRQYPYWSTTTTIIVLSFKPVAASFSSTRSDVFFLMATVTSPSVIRSNSTQNSAPDISVKCGVVSYCRRIYPLLWKRANQKTTWPINDTSFWKKLRSWKLVSIRMSWNWSEFAKRGILIISVS